MTDTPKPEPALTAAPPARQAQDWKCLARNSSSAEAVDCDWPKCGCDPYADKVIAALEEEGLFSSARQAQDELQTLVRHGETLLQYCRWTIGPESCGHHPTMPSAVGQFSEALKPFAHLGYRPVPLSTATDQTQDGMAMLPRHPTQSMMDAGLYHTSHDGYWADVFTAYQAMWDAFQRDGDTGAAPPPAEPTAPLAYTDGERAILQASLRGDGAEIDRLIQAPATPQPWPKEDHGAGVWIDVEPTELVPLAQGESGEVLPCPFCGEEARIVYTPKGEYFVQCTRSGNCYGHHDMRQEGYTFRRDAAEVWNRRVSTARANAELDDTKRKADIYTKLQEMCAERGWPSPLFALAKVSELTARTAKAEAANAELEQPDMWWDAEDAEQGGLEPYEIVESYAVGQVVRLQCAKRLPDRFAVRLPDDLDDGDYGETLDFATAEEAESAYARSLASHQQPRDTFGKGEAQ